MEGSQVRFLRLLLIPVAMQVYSQINLDLRLWNLPRFMLNSCAFISMALIMYA
uniref:Uncharacterized protein n=1 Tax=Arundo donax TaxID=35708 RepID=A0A0A9C4K9_ARUDO